MSVLREWLCCQFVFIVSFDFVVFFFNDTATTEIYTLSLHDALPISFQPSEYYIWFSDAWLAKACLQAYLNPVSRFGWVEHREFW